MDSSPLHARWAWFCSLIVVLSTAQLVSAQAGSPPSAAGEGSTTVAAAPSPVPTYSEPDTSSQLRSARTTPKRCLLGNFCFGPVLTLGVLDVFGAGLHARTDHWGLSADYQFFYFTARDIPITLSLLTVEGRFYPFAGAFFVSAGVAWQRAAFSAHVTYRGDSNTPAIDADLRAHISVPVFKVGIGFLGRSRFILGVDLALGVQLGKNSVSFSSSLPRVEQVVDAENQIRDRANTWVRAIPFLVQLNLIRIGYLF